MKKFEYQTIIIEPKGVFGGKVNAESFNQAFLFPFDFLLQFCFIYGIMG